MWRATEKKKKKATFIFVTYQASFHIEGQWSTENCPSQLAMFTYLPLWLSNTNSVEVTIGESPAVTRDGLSLGVFERMANHAKGVGYLSGMGHL